MHFFTPRLVGEVVGKACHLGCPKIVLDHVHVYNILYKLCLCAPQCLHLFATAANHKAWCMASNEALFTKAYLT